MSAEHFDPRVFAMLGNRSPAEFIQLPVNRRQEILVRSQVRQTKPVEIDESGEDDILNRDIAGSFILRQQDLVGDNEVGQQICREASEIYFQRNTFAVDLH